MRVRSVFGPRAPQLPGPAKRKRSRTPQNPVDEVRPSLRRVPARERPGPASGVDASRDACALSWRCHARPASAATRALAGGARSLREALALAISRVCRSVLGPRRLRQPQVLQSVRNGVRRGRRVLPVRRRRSNLRRRGRGVPCRLRRSRLSLAHAGNPCCSLDSPSVRRSRRRIRVCPEVSASRHRVARETLCGLRPGEGEPVRACACQSERFTAVSVAGIACGTSKFQLSIKCQFRG